MKRFIAVLPVMDKSLYAYAGGVLAGMNYINSL